MGGLRQEALAVERRDEQHMTAYFQRSLLTVLPFFHVGGLKHPDHAGAAARCDRDDPSALHAGRNACRHLADHPTLNSAGTRDHSGVTEHPELGFNRSVLAKAISTGSTIVPPHLIDRFVARGVRCFRSTARPKPVRRRLYAPRRRSFAGWLDRPARPVLARRL